MQVTFVASAYTSGNAPGGGWNIVVNKPTGTVDGDLMIAHFSSASSNATIATLAGWTLLDSDATGGNGWSGIFYKIASSEGASYSWGVGDSGGTARTAVGISTWRDASAIDVHSKNVDTTSDTTANGSAVTPTMSPDCVLIAFTGSISTGATLSAHAVANNNPTWTEIYDSSITCAYGIYTAITTTGAYTATISTAVTSTTFLVSIKPAGFSIDGAFTLTGTPSDAVSSAMTPVTAVFSLVGTISAVVAQGVGKWSNVVKSVTTWVNQSKN